MTAGFTSILTQCLAMHTHSGAPELKWLELLATRPPKEAGAEWERLRRSDLEYPRLVVDNTRPGL